MCINWSGPLSGGLSHIVFNISFHYWLSQTMEERSLHGTWYWGSYKATEGRKGKVFGNPSPALEKCSSILSLLPWSLSIPPLSLLPPSLSPLILPSLSSLFTRYGQWWSTTLNTTSPRPLNHRPKDSNSHLTYINTSPQMHYKLYQYNGRGFIYIKT